VNNLGSFFNMVTIIKSYQVKEETLMPFLFFPFFAT